jgi:hypothetical protein
VALSLRRWRARSQLACRAPCAGQVPLGPSSAARLSRPDGGSLSFCVTYTCPVHRPDLPNAPTRLRPVMCLCSNRIESARHRHRVDSANRSVVFLVVVIVITDTLEQRKDTALPPPSLWAVLARSLGVGEHAADAAEHVLRALSGARTRGTPATERLRLVTTLAKSVRWTGATGAAPSGV